MADRAGAGEAHHADRHPHTGRFLAYDCEVDCLVRCAGLCGVGLSDEAAAFDSIEDDRREFERRMP